LKRRRSNVKGPFMFWSLRFWNCHKKDPWINCILTPALSRHFQFHPWILILQFWPQNFNISSIKSLNNLIPISIKSKNLSIIQLNPWFD
jgi:hypothetical protein